MTTTINASTSSGLVNTADTSGILQLQTASTAAVTIDASQNVGIGTASPSYKLDVVSTGNSLNSNLASRNTTSGTAAGAQILVGNDSTNDLLVLRALSSTYTSSGVNTANGALVRGGGAGGMTLAATDASGIINFATGGTTERMRIDSSGNVGIGTSSPAAKFNISGSSAAAYIGNYLDNTASNGYVRLDLRIGSSGANGIASIKYAPGIFMQIGPDLNDTTTPLVFATNNATERARIDTSGNLLVGTTSDPNGGGIAVYKSTNGATIANFQNTYAGSGGQAIRAKINSAGNNTSSYLFVGSSNNDVCYIYGNGNIVNSNNSYGTLSDVKLKENIVDATPKLAEVMQLKVRNFNLKTEPDHKQIGFIAQELEQVFPALIDNTTSPNDPDDVIKSIKTSVLVPILVKAIQELKAINDTQAETINALTARIVALEGQ